MRLKWGQTEYKGTLVSVDSYMNIQLNETEEFIDRKSTGSLGQVLIRFVLYVWRRATGDRTDVLTWSSVATTYYGYRLRRGLRMARQEM